jgi:eukaryotic-like serine/threonine-protein kinase
MSGDEREPAEGSLRDRLRACQEAGLPGIPVSELLRHVRDVAAQLDSLHGQSRLYGDVKPENVRLLKGQARLADSGMVQVLPGKGVSAGTPVYLAPEGWRGRTDARSDQYSLAVTYAEMRFGRRPFSGESLVEFFREHLDGTPDLAPFPEPERQVLLKALAKKPEQRYPSCLSFAQELERVVVR